MKDHPAAYQASQGGTLALDAAFYDRIAAETAGRSLVEQFTIPIRTGRTWRVPAGRVFRIVVVEGPKLGKLNPEDVAVNIDQVFAASLRRDDGGGAARNESGA